ncbi:hypothetical protein EDB80DRAFT_675416 [Ilyonectria destructans]|nr:hypothetical protein EDB80DRAFT_675416 [Ilyonectria destructans]
MSFGYSPRRIFPDERRSDRVTSAGPGGASIANHGAGTTPIEPYRSRKGRVENVAREVVSRGPQEHGRISGVTTAILILSLGLLLGEIRRRAQDHQLSRPTDQTPFSVNSSTGGGMSRAAGGTGARVRRCGPEPISAGRMRKRLALASLAVCWGDDPWCKVYLVRGRWSVRRESPGCIAHADARHLEMLRRGLFARCDAVRRRTQSQPLAANPARLLASRGRGRRDLARIYCTHPFRPPRSCKLGLLLGLRLQGTPPNVDNEIKGQGPSQISATAESQTQRRPSLTSIRQALQISLGLALSLQLVPEPKAGRPGGSAAMRKPHVLAYILRQNLTSLIIYSVVWLRAARKLLQRATGPIALRQCRSGNAIDSAGTFHDAQAHPRGDNTDRALYTSAPRMFDQYPLNAKHGTADHA